MLREYSDSDGDSDAMMQCPCDDEYYPEEAMKLRHRHASVEPGRSPPPAAVRRGGARPEYIGRPPRPHVGRIAACLLAPVVALYCGFTAFLLLGGAWDPSTAGAPWRQPVCSVDGIVESQGARLGSLHPVEQQRPSCDPGDDGCRPPPTNVLMVHGTVQNFLSLLRGIGDAGSRSRATLLVDVLAPGYEAGRPLDHHCDEVGVRMAGMRAAVGGVGHVADPHNVDLVCAGYGTDDWGGVDRQSRGLAMALGSSRYPHTPAFVGSPVAHDGVNGSTLVVSVGMPMTHEVVSWTMGLAEQRRGGGVARVVFLGFATHDEIRKVLSVACDRLWSPFGITDVTGGLKCGRVWWRGWSPRVEKYFIAAFQSGADPAQVSRICAGQDLALRKLFM